MTRHNAHQAVLADNRVAVGCNPVSRHTRNANPYPRTAPNLIPRMQPELFDPWLNHTLGKHDVKELQVVSQENRFTGTSATYSESLSDLELGF